MCVQRKQKNAEKRDEREGKRTALSRKRKKNGWLVREAHIQFSLLLPPRREKEIKREFRAGKVCGYFSDILSSFPSFNYLWKVAARIHSVYEKMDIFLRRRVEICRTGRKRGAKSRKRARDIRPSQHFGVMENIKRSACILSFMDSSNLNESNNFPSWCTNCNNCVLFSVNKRHREILISAHGREPLAHRVRCSCSFHQSLFARVWRTHTFSFCSVVNYCIFVWGSIFANTGQSKYL